MLRIDFFSHMRILHLEACFWLDLKSPFPPFLKGGCKQLYAPLSNSTYPRTSRRLSRCFNTTGSKSSVDRWKHQEADKYDVAEITQKLKFSGMLSQTPHMPAGARLGVSMCR